MKKKSVGLIAFNIFNIFIMLLIVAVTLMPYIHILAKALNEGTDTSMGGILFWPRKFTFENISTLIKDTTMYQAFAITILRVVLGSALGIAVQLMAGYALSDKQLPGLKAVTIFFIIPMSFSGGLIPLYALYSKMRLLNSFWVYVLPSLFSFYNVLVIKSYMRTSIPDSLKEAARIDGFDEFNIFLKIVVPLSKPILVTVLLWLAVGHWNDWTTTLYFVNKPRLATLQYKLMQVIKESERLMKLQSEAAVNGMGMQNISKTTPESLVSAQIFITTVPIVILYPFVQKYFVMGVTLGSVKE